MAYRFFILLCAINFSLASENSFLWRINTNPPSYLFGTIHVPYSRVWDSVPHNAKVAFNRSSHLYLEIVQRDETVQILPVGQNISEILPEDVYLKLKYHVRYLRKAMDNWITPEQKKLGLNASSLFDNLFGNFEIMHPFWLLMLLPKMNRHYISTVHIPDLDSFLALSAKSQRKGLAGLEEPKDRSGPISKIGLPEIILGLNITLHHLDEDGTSKFETVLDKIIDAYRRGNLTGATDAEAVEMKVNLSEKEQLLSKKFSAASEERVLHDRNKQMGDKIVSILKAKSPGDSYFFAVGAGHYSGKHRIQEVVREAGFRVDHLGPEDDLDDVNWMSPQADSGVSGVLTTNNVFIAVLLPCIVTMALCDLQ